MTHDYTHAAALQAGYEGPCVDVGTFTTDAWGRAFAAAAGALAAIGADMGRADLEEQLAEYLHEHNSAGPESNDAIAAEWDEARRVAGLLIEQYKRQPASAATYLCTRFTPSQPVNRGCV